MGSIKRVIILHGTLGSPKGNWFPWLEKVLTERGLEVWIPQLPNADHPSLREWGDFVHNNSPFALDEDTVVVGHSSGAILALLLAQEATEAIGGVVAVSVFYDNSLGWAPNNRLFDVTLDYDDIRDHILNGLCVHSDNDPYVPLDQARFVADRVDLELVVLEGQGHFNLEQSAAYMQFPWLVDMMETKGWV